MPRGESSAESDSGSNEGCQMCGRVSEIEGRFGASRIEGQLRACVRVRIKMRARVGMRARPSASTGSSANRSTSVGAMITQKCRQ